MSLSDKTNEVEKFEIHYILLLDISMQTKIVIASMENYF